MIGDVGLGAIAGAVNPTNSVVNCGNIIDAVVARLTGTNPNAVAPAGRDGSWAQIDARLGTTVQWGHTFQDAFDAVQKGGDGTIAVIGIDYGPGKGSHVVIMTNANGQATIVEGQDWGPGNPKEADSTPARANARYNKSGTTDVGIGIVRTGRGP